MDSYRKMAVGSTDLRFWREYVKIEETTAEKIGLEI